MIERKTLDPRTLNGGINMMRLPSSAEEPKELPWAENFWPDGVGVRQRGGTELIGEHLGGTPDILHGFPTAGFLSIAKETANLWTQDIAGTWLRQNIPFGYIPGDSTAESGPLFETVQWNRDVYATGDGANPASLYIIRPYNGLNPGAWAGKFYARASYDMSTFTPVAVNSAAGTIPAGTFSWRITAYDPESGTETNASRPSNNLTLAANRKVSLTTPVGLPARFTKIRIYRSVTNVPLGPWLRAAEVTSDATVFDTAPTSALGVALDTSVIAVPGGMFSVTLFANRLAFTDGRFVYISHANRPEEVDGTTVFAYPDDEILQVVGGDRRLFVMCRNKIRVIEGTGATTWQQFILDAEHGQFHRRGAVYAAGTLYWMSDTDVFKSDGVSPGTPLSGSAPDCKIGPLLKKRKDVVRHTVKPGDPRLARFSKFFKGAFFLSGSPGGTATLNYHLGYSTLATAYFPFVFPNDNEFDMVDVRVRLNPESPGYTTLPFFLFGSEISKYSPEIVDDDAVLMFPALDFGPGKGSLQTVILKSQVGPIHTAAGRLLNDMNIFDATDTPPGWTVEQDDPTTDWKRYAIPRVIGYQSPMLHLTFSGEEPVYFENYSLDVRQNQKRIRRAPIAST